LQLKNGCVVGALRGTSYADSASTIKNPLSTYFSNVASASRRIWRNLMEACLISNPSIIWDDIVGWYYKLKGKELQVILCQLSLAAAVYHVWRLINDLCFGNSLLSEEALVACVKWEVRTRVMSNRKFKSSSLSVRLSKVWML
jgi:hypothetical protein